MHSHNVSMLCRISQRAERHSILLPTPTEDKEDQESLSEAEQYYSVGCHYLLKSLEKDFSSSLITLSSSSSSSSSSSHDLVLALWSKWYPHLLERSAEKFRKRNEETTDDEATDEATNKDSLPLKILIPGVGTCGIVHRLLQWWEEELLASASSLSIDGCDVSWMSLALGVGMLSHFGSQGSQGIGRIKMKNKSEIETETEKSDTSGVAGATTAETAVQEGCSSPIVIYPESGLSSCVDVPRNSACLWCRGKEKRGDEEDGGGEDGGGEEEQGRVVTTPVVRMFHCSFHHLLQSSRIPSSQHNVIITEFFLDVVPNIVETLIDIQHSLVGGGMWLNVGCLKYHVHNHEGPRMTMEEILMLCNHMERMHVVEHKVVENVMYNKESVSSTIDCETYSCLCLVVFVDEAA